MAGDGMDRQRERTRHGASADTVFLPALAGSEEMPGRAVVRHDVYLRALESAREVLRAHNAERRRFR